MRGMIFREFLEMVESKSGYEYVDEIRLNTLLEKNCIYTSTSTLNHSELSALGNAVSTNTGIPLQQLFVLSGKHVFNIFSQSFDHLTLVYGNPFQFLASTKNTTHAVGLKLYPETELPSFKAEKKNEDKIIMIYNTSRKMVDFAEDLIIGCFDYYKIGVTIKKQTSANVLALVKFKIKKSNI